MPSCGWSSWPHLVSEQGHSTGTTPFEGDAEQVNCCEVFAMSNALRSLEAAHRPKSVSLCCTGELRRIEFRRSRPNRDSCSLSKETIMTLYSWAILAIVVILVASG